MKNILNTSLLTGALYLTCLTQVHGFGYIFAKNNGVDIVAHASNYDGTGGVVNVTVGIDTTSDNSADMILSVQNVIRTFNAMNVTTDNLSSDFVGIPSGAYDFESVLLHEMGHSLGLTHTNIGGSGSNDEYTNATVGANLVYDTAPGADGVEGSGDDIRGDDVNLNYFKIADNDPFTIAGTVDSTTYSRDIADLLGGDIASANASRDVANLLGYGTSTESAMQQGTFNNEIQRTLVADDVAGLLYAQTGLDSIAGNSDDYTLNITYVGLVGAGLADIVIDFDDSETGFAVSQSGGSFLSGDDIVITSNNIYFNDSSTWHYNTVSNAIPEPSTLLFSFVGIGALMLRRKRS